jgi:two-component system response regulator
MPEAPIRILLVEDNPGDIRLFQVSLELSTVPHSLEVVNDGQEALDYLYRRGAFTGAQRPDILVMDPNLPRVSGFEVLRRVKADPSLAALPVLILAGGIESEVLHAYELYANCYIWKPSDVDEYLQAIRLTLEYWSRVVRLPRQPKA